MYMKYLDLPTVPEHLLEDVATILAKPVLPDGALNVRFRNFELKEITPELNDWLVANLPFEIHSANYQIIYAGIRIHIDVFANTVVNYILNTGGDNVETFFCDKSYKDTECERFPARTWHKLNVDKPHGVRGINPGRTAPRVALRVHPLNQQDFNAI
jgi:hypothetical protein